MCGIAGWIGPKEDGPGLIEGMTQLLRHRGPDGAGFKTWPLATFIHTRLSLIDLSPAGAQPMATPDGSVWTVFNGEIYNHHELRRELEAKGRVFKGRSDTEVVPHLYQEYGPAFLGKLRGMFALAIYDVRARRLLLARDRFGIKPLFYAPCPVRLAFASEIPALRLLPDADVQPDLQALSDFSALSFVPSPSTFFKGIRALEPGQFLEAEMDQGRVRWQLKRFHEWNLRVNEDQSLRHAVDRAQALIERAVQRQLESDVPVGCLLSGGIDSSLVSAAAKNGSAETIRTFNVRFSESAYDETWAAVQVAGHIGSVHQTLDMPAQSGTWEAITGLLQCAGQPYADTSLFGANAVCRLMRKEVTVALSGDGGDEGFGGYERFRRIKSLRLWGKVPASLGPMACAALQPLARFGVIPKRTPERLSALAGQDGTGILENLICWVRPEEHRQWLNFNGVLPARRLFEPRWKCELPKGAGELERLSAHATEVGVRLLLADDYLFKVDLVSMHESLEVRVPMLDEDLFDFGLALPHKLKVDGRFCKRVLRGVADRALPASVARKPKQGFMTPVDAWVDADFKGQLRETLRGPESPIKELFNQPACNRLIEAFCSDRPCPGISREGLYQRIVMLLSVHLALRPYRR
ncbi:MAG TPA: asparagine synthase (glutamine-hydrolyzing) [Verrucomicrobiae bacterium]|jgi:asparagine synthase (glutamine-hydrolysing)